MLPWNAIYIARFAVPGTRSPYAAQIDGPDLAAPSAPERGTPIVIQCVRRRRVARRALRRRQHIEVQVDGVCIHYVSEADGCANN